jgi:hypothetical protein
LQREAPLDKGRRSPAAGEQETRLVRIFIGRAPSSRAAHSAPLDLVCESRIWEPRAQAAKALEREAELGKSARTPVIALTGVTLFVSVLLAIMRAVTMTLYFVYGGH